MSQLFGILVAMMQLARIVIIALGIYSYLIRPRFLDGLLAAPYWLLRFYNWGAPQLLYFVLFFMVIVWPIAFIGNLIGFSMPGEIKPLKKLLWTSAILAFIAAFPVLPVTFEHMEMEQLGESNYYLMRQEAGSSASYGVFECHDPAGFSCNAVLWSPELPAPPPTPTPIPNTSIEVNGQTITVAPPFVPTVTPSAEFVLDTTGSEISIKVGTQRVVITSTVGTLSELPEPEPVEE